MRSGWYDHGRRQLCKCNGNKDKRNQLFGSPKMIPLLFFVLDLGFHSLTQGPLCVLKKLPLKALKNGTIYNPAFQPPFSKRCNFLFPYHFDRDYLVKYMPLYALVNCPHFSLFSQLVFRAGWPCVTAAALAKDPWSSWYLFVPCKIVSLPALSFYCHFDQWHTSLSRKFNVTTDHL